MGWTVRCHATFEAAHHLVDYVGGPEPAHGHSWKIEVALAVDRLGTYDLSVDFVPTEAFVKELASRLHNRDLNAVPPFDRKNSSAENVALWLLARPLESFQGAILVGSCQDGDWHFRWRGNGCFSLLYRRFGGLCRVERC